jgi:hypothetical protein
METIRKRKADSHGPERTHPYWNMIANQMDADEKDRAARK